MPKLKPNTHTCEIKQDTFGLPKLPPNASWFRKFCRRIRKYLTLNPNSTRSKRFFRNKSTMIIEQKRHLQGAPFIIHPFSSFNSIREVLFCILWIIEMILSPIYMSFIQIERVHDLKQHNVRRYESFLIFYKLIVAPLETIIVSLFFITGYINNTTKEIVIEPTKIIKKYLCTFYMVDFIMCIKFGIYSEVTRLMYLMNMTCMLRVSTVFSYLRQIVLNCKMREEVYDCMRLFVITLIILNSYGCFFYYIPWLLGKEKFAPNSWVVRANISPQEEVTIIQAYAECMLCIVCHFFGAGEGMQSIQSHDVIEKLLLVIVMITGKTRTKDKYRIVYSDHQKVELEKEFYYSRYITIRRKAELSSMLGLSERQIKIWFQNRRAKERKQIKKTVDINGCVKKEETPGLSLQVGFLQETAHNQVSGLT